MYWTDRQSIHVSASMPTQIGQDETFQWHLRKEERASEEPQQELRAKAEQRKEAKKKRKDLELREARRAVLLAEHPEQLVDVVVPGLACLPS